MADEKDTPRGGASVSQTPQRDEGTGLAQHREEPETFESPGDSETSTGLAQHAEEPVEHVDPLTASLREKSRTARNKARDAKDADEA